jgi:recombination protein RecT
MATTQRNTIAKAANAVTTRNAEKPMTMQAYIQRMEGEIAKALPSVITPERFTRIVLSALSSTPKLQETTPKSFLGAMMQAAQLGLEPNTALGQAYLIPRNNRRAGTIECQFQIGYKGLIDLAYRSGEVITIQAHTVYSNDEFDYAYGLDPTLTHVPAKADRGEPIFFYAMYKTKDGGYGFYVMSMDDVQKHAKKYSESYKGGYSSPWQTNFEEMAKKTVLKQVLKYAPMKTDFARALSADETIKTDLSADMFSVPDEPIYADVEVVDSETGEIVAQESLIPTEDKKD